MNEHECYEVVADCRLRAAADLFAHTWNPVVLAALGQSLIDGPMKALGSWIVDHGDELLDAQENSATSAEHG